MPLFGPMIWAGLFGYFAYHTIQGDRGVLALVRLDNEVAEARETRDALVADRTVIQARVGSLRESSLDVDLLVERARDMLNFAHPDDIVIITR